MYGAHLSRFFNFSKSEGVLFWECPLILVGIGLDYLVYRLIVCVCVCVCVCVYACFQAFPTSFAVSLASQLCHFPFANLRSFRIRELQFTRGYVSVESCFVFDHESMGMIHLHLIHPSQTYSFVFMSLETTFVSAFWINTFCLDLY